MDDANVLERNAPVCVTMGGVGSLAASLLVLWIALIMGTATMENVFAHPVTQGRTVQRLVALMFAWSMGNASTTLVFVVKATLDSIAHFALVQMIALEMATVMTEPAIASLDGLEINARCWDVPMIVLETDGATRAFADALQASPAQIALSECALTHALGMECAMLTSHVHVTQDFLALIAL